MEISFLAVVLNESDHYQFTVNKYLVLTFYCCRFGTRDQNRFTVSLCSWVDGNWTTSSQMEDDLKVGRRAGEGSNRRRRFSLIRVIENLF